MVPPPVGSTREKLLNHSFAVGTAERYKDMWEMFLQFLLDQDLDMCTDSLCQYIEYLYDEKLWSYSTIASQMSGIAHYLELYELPNFTDRRIITLMLRGIRNLGYEPDVRLPFTEEHLQELIGIVRRGVQDVYLRFLYCTIFSWAFYACLRSSEYAECKYTDHLLKVGDITQIKLGMNFAYRVRFRSFKHSPVSFPDMILHKTRDYDSCPVALMNIYMSLRPPAEPDEPLFVDSNGAVSRETIALNLKKCLPHMGLSPAKYKLHSFRIGRATMWAEKGYSDTQIKSMGRWYSNAFMRYIRTLVVLQ